jgi:hypothetical protein
LAHGGVIPAQIGFSEYFSPCPVSNKRNTLGNGWRPQNFNWSQRKMMFGFLKIRDELVLDSCGPQRRIRILR